MLGSEPLPCPQCPLLLKRRPKELLSNLGGFFPAAVEPSRVSAHSQGPPLQSARSWCAPSSVLSRGRAHLAPPPPPTASSLEPLLRAWAPCPLGVATRGQGLPQRHCHQRAPRAKPEPMPYPLSSQGVGWAGPLWTLVSQTKSAVAGPLQSMPALTSHPDALVSLSPSPR